jgi:hypothetical protein
MKISILKNEDSIFKDETVSAGLDLTSGWWYSIHAADIDMDGDMDLIGGNLGLNSILKASPGQPVEMYLNDFDNNGSLDQIICSYDDGISYPVASLDDLASQITGFGNNYPNYSDFGGKTVFDIFGKSILEKSAKKEAVMFESCVFRNNGDGTFITEKLPVESQFSPVRDIIVSDINHDGINDLVVAGNNYPVRPSYGRYDASYGWYLAGESSGVFKTMMPIESGLIIKGDARKILPLKVSQKNYIVVAVNDGELKLFEIQSGK